MISKIESYFSAYYQKHPISCLIWIAVLVRLIAVVFSKGYGWHDDHFLVPEIAQSWIDIGNRYHWMDMPSAARGAGHSFFYPSLHYVVFLICKWIGIADPQLKMTLVRALHAAFSLLTVRYAYLLTYQLTAHRHLSFGAGLSMALYWFAPMLSVRTLAEWTCTPLILAAHYYHIKNNKTHTLIIAGLLLGLALNMRYQLGFYALGWGIALIIQQQWRSLFYLVLGSCITFIGYQGINDYMIHGKPMAEFLDYIRYNIEARNEYISNTWYSYLLLILGITLPPLCFVFPIGIFYVCKRYLPICLPIVLFIAFHSYFPNKQERFILPIVPIYIIMGIIGFYFFYKEKNLDWWQKKWLRTTVYIALVINAVACIALCTTYSKRARVESMYMLKDEKNIQDITLERSHHDHVPFAPLFYMNQWSEVHTITGSHPLDVYKKELETSQIKPSQFVLFYEEKNLESRVNALQAIYPSLTFHSKATPGWIDRLVHWLNPINSNEVIFIYKTQ